MTDGELIKCVVCADDATPRVVKDSGYNAMMGLLWEVMNVDVKYSENVKFDLCCPCFDQILQFYDLNDGCIIMEKRIKFLTRKMINKAIGGVEKLGKTNQPTLEVQDKIIEKYGKEPIDENVDDSGIKFEYEFECSVLDAATAESKVSSKTKIKEEAQKTTFSFSNLPAVSEDSKQVEKDDSGDANTPRTRAQKATKSVRFSVARGRGRGRGRKSTRGRRKLSSSEEEEEEEDVYSESEEDDDSTEIIPAKSKRTTSTKEPSVEEQMVVDESSGSEKEKDTEDDKSKASTEAESQNTGKCRMQCEICFTAVMSAKAYEAHVKRHTVEPGAGFQCRVCRKAYENKEDFMRHKKLHDDGTYPCPVCNSVFEVESKSIQHVQTIHRDYWNRQPQTLLPAGSD